MLTENVRQIFAAEKKQKALKYTFFSKVLRAFQTYMKVMKVIQPFLHQVSEIDIKLTAKPIILKMSKSTRVWLRLPNFKIIVCNLFVIGSESSILVRQYLVEILIYLP